jgi:hypothetical protein
MDFPPMLRNFSLRRGHFRNFILPLSHSRGKPTGQNGKGLEEMDSKCNRQKREWKDSRER